MRHHKPKCALLENVPGLVTLESGEAIRIIMQALSNEGYCVSYHIIDAALLVPQHRKRVYIVAIRQDLCVPPPPSTTTAAAGKTGSKWRFIWPPFIPNLHRTVSEIIEPPNRIKNFESFVLPEASWYHVKALPEFKEKPHYKLAPLYTAPAATLISSYRTSTWKHAQFVPLFEHLSSSTIPAEPKPKYTSIAAFLSVLPAPRRYTARECARLQGFSEDFVDTVHDTAHDPDQPSGSTTAVMGIRAFYKAIGNAVSPPIVAVVAGSLLCAIDHRYVRTTVLLEPFFSSFRLRCLLSAAGGVIVVDCVLRWIWCLTRCQPIATMLRPIDCVLGLSHCRMAAPLPSLHYTTR